MERPTFGEKFRALLATGRVANLPTVWSNVLVGFWMASYLSGNYRREELETARLLLVAATCLVASCVYVGGCLLGDAADVEFDRKHRPNRPLPQGTLTAGTVKFTAYCLFALALFGMFSSTLVTFLGALYWHEDIPLREIMSLFSQKSTLAVIQVHELLLGCTLIACVVAYAFFHKRIGKKALVLMAACRFMLVLYAISAAHKSFFSHSYDSGDPVSLYADWATPWMFLLAAAVGIYTLLLSWVASTESDGQKFNRLPTLGWLLLAMPLLTVGFQLLLSKPTQESYYWDDNGNTIYWGDQTIHWNVYLLSLAAVFLWLFLALRTLQNSKPAFVSRALAGFCLLDAAFIAPFFPAAALACAGLFALALLLQRVAPAT